MQQNKNKINERKVEEFMTFHIKALKQLLEGKDFEEIRQEYAADFERLNYLEVATTHFSFLSLDDSERLKAAYPISPKKTNYKISVDGVGSGYVMCAIDSLGAAYTFNAKTMIESRDPVSKNAIKIVIDPDNLEITPYSEIVVTVPKAIPEKKECEVIDSAVDFCPLIGFFENVDSVPEEQYALVDVAPFQKAFDYGKRIFAKKNLEQDLRSGLILLLRLYQSDTLSQSEVIKLYLENPSNCLPESLTQEDIKTLIIKQLKGKGVVRDITQKNSQVNYLELTDRGERILKTFLDYN